MNKVHFDGYKKFKTEYYENNKELFDNLIDSQSPHTMVITCSDSRVQPSKILSAAAGEIFIARNIGNIVPPYKRTQGATQAAIEYAVNVLKVEHIVILGHSNCGACKHMYHVKTEEEEKIELSHVEEWLKLAYPAKNNSLLECFADPSKERSEVTEKNNIQLSVQRLMSYPYIIEALEQQKLKLHGWWYDIGTGEMQVYSYSTKMFESIELHKEEKELKDVL
jgi:carbonic anhydrase